MNNSPRHPSPEDSALKLVPVGTRIFLLGEQQTSTCSFLSRYSVTETSLGVQWLRVHTPNTGGLGSIPGQGTRYHMLQLRSGTVK